jgi:hypothetical protein
MTMGRLGRASLLIQAGLLDEATASYQQAGPPETWSLPPFAVLLGYMYGALGAAELGRYDDLAAVLDRLEPFRGEHAIGEGIYMGPIELTFGRPAAALGRLDGAIDDLAVAVEQADRAGAPGSWPRRATTSRARCSLATAPATGTVPSPPPATPTASHEGSAWRPTSTAPPPWSPSLLRSALAGGVPP